MAREDAAKTITALARLEERLLVSLIPSDSAGTILLLRCKCTDTDMAHEFIDRATRIRAVDHVIAPRSMLIFLTRADDRSAILEVRAGTGGQEAQLFARELFEMYAAYARHKQWEYEVMDYSQTEIGGVRVRV
jgi:protein subunit release factor A